jgi:DNA-binding response OmpR family regulator
VLCRIRIPARSNRRDNKFKINNTDITFTRDEILNLVWGNEAIVGERTIDVHVRKLREKLGDDYIRTVKGIGYTFNQK